jgi:hypothetical protein
VETEWVIVSTKDLHVGDVVKFDAGYTRILQIGEIDETRITPRIELSYIEVEQPNDMIGSVHTSWFNVEAVWPVLIKPVSKDDVVKAHAALLEIGS